MTQIKYHLKMTHQASVIYLYHVKTSHF